MQLEAFLKNESYFALGHLPTEQMHPDTIHLAELSQTDLDRAIGILQKIDVAAIAVVEDQISQIEELARDIEETLQSGRSIFISGCGATGRLALSLEFLFRKMHSGRPRENQVHAIMAGGDFALVKSVENFEDHPEYGRKHLKESGFSDGDLLIAVSEGGETPYVLGTVLGALDDSRRPVWFVYCNPRDILVDTVPRSREVITHPNVKSLNLVTGPMALSGSTRLQAATCQMLAVGSALFRTAQEISRWKQAYESLDLATFLKPGIVWESLQYAEGNVVLYETSDYPIAVLTDTTERAPTFSLTPFEKSTETTPTANPSLVYLCIPDANDAKAAWQQILYRSPHGLDWPELSHRLDLSEILKFDFSRNAKSARAKRVKPRRQVTLSVRREARQIVLQNPLAASRISSELLSHPLSEQLLMKLILNLHSLLVMGRLGRYEGNVMTWVRASNGKLIDRTLRYLEFLIQKRNLPHPGRLTLIQKIFLLKDQIGTHQGVILEILKSLEP